MANKDKLLANAQKFLSKGQIPKAISEYQKLVDAFPKDVRNRQKLAELYSRDKRNENALTEYETVAKHYTETGFYLKAIAVFKQMQKIEPSRVDIYYSLAELNEKQGLVGNALTEYRNLISFYNKNEMHHEAIEVLEKMLDLDPGNLNFSAKITEMYMISGQEEQAFEKFQEIINPLVANEEHTKIIKLYERFLDICSEEGTARLPLARALLNSGSSDKAVQILKSLLKHSPEDPDINQCLTDAYVASQDFANARLTLKHLLKQKEDDLGLREYYVRICIDAGEMERARDRLEEWKDAFFQAERITVLQGFYEEIKEHLTDDPLVAETLFAIYEAVGDTAKLDELTAPEGVSVETSEIAETADAAVIDVAIDDVETLDMVGEEAVSDVDVPPLDEKPSVGTVTIGKNATAGLELELDLDLDLEVSAAQEEDVAAFVDSEPEPIQEDEAAEVSDIDEDIEIEIEIDLDDMGDLELEFEDDEPTVEDEEPVVEEELAAEENELVAEDNELVVEEDELVVEEDELVVEEDELVVEEDELVVEEDELAVEEDELVVEEDELVVEDDELVVEDDELVVEDDELVVEEDELVVEENELVVEEDELAAEEDEPVDDEVSEDNVADTTEELTIAAEDLEAQLEISTVTLDIDEDEDEGAVFEEQIMPLDDLELSVDDNSDISEAEKGAESADDAQDESDQLEPFEALEVFDSIAEPEALDDVAELDDVDSAEDIEVSSADAFMEALEKDDEPEVLEELEDVDSLEDLEELEELEAVEPLEDLEELEELEDVESLDELEDLEELEEIEALEEIEELEVLEEVEASSDEASAEAIDSSSALNVDAELEEAEFYLQQGLYDDAERVVKTLIGYRPELPELQAKMDEINQGRQAAEAESESTAFVDLMSDLQDDDLLAATDFLDSFAGEAPEEEEFSQKLVSELDSSDTESHYDLGIAYKEMGLYDDAIAEFGKAAKDPVRTIDCITLTGQCHVEAGETDAAMKAFKSALAHERLTEDARMTLNFELGMLHQLNGLLLEALESFQLVAEKDSFFRDVAGLIKNLRRELGLDDDSDDDGGPQGNRDRVSYV